MIRSVLKKVVFSVFLLFGSGLGLNQNSFGMAKGISASRACNGCPSLSGSYFCYEGSFRYDFEMTRSCPSCLPQYRVNLFALKKAEKDPETESEKKPDKCDEEVLHAFDVFQLGYRSTQVIESSDLEKNLILKSFCKEGSFFIQSWNENDENSESYLRVFLNHFQQLVIQKGTLQFNEFASSEELICDRKRVSNIVIPEKGIGP